MSEKKEVKEKTILYKGKNYPESECIKVGHRWFPKSEIIHIGGITFIRSGVKGMTRKTFDFAYGNGDVNKNKNPNGHTKTQKQLDMIWEKLQKELGEDSVEATKPVVVKK